MVELILEGRAFALIKTEGLDETSRTPITREAQAMGRLGSLPHIVTVYALGEEEGQPYLITELMGLSVTAAHAEELAHHFTQAAAIVGPKPPSSTGT